MKKILIAVISIALVVFLSFGAYADIIQPNATQFELGYSLSTAQNTITDIVQFSALPYTYNAQLMMNGNNNALYTYGLYNISGFTDSDQIATSYNFVGGQSYEVTYRFSMQFADNSLASYLEYIDPQLIGINAYFTNDLLASFTNGMPSSTIASYSSNYSASITNETVVSSHDPDVAGTVSFDVVLLFKLNLNYSGSFHKILLNLDFHNFATAIPSGNSGFFYCQLTYQSLENLASPSWNTLPVNGSYTFAYLSSDEVTGGTGTMTSSGRNLYSTSIFSPYKSISSNSYSPYFMRGFSYRGSLLYHLSYAIDNGNMVGGFGISSFGLSSGANVFGTNASSALFTIPSSWNLSYDLSTEVYSSTSSSVEYECYLTFSFTVPSDFTSFYSFFFVVFDVDPVVDPRSPTYWKYTGSLNIEFDSSGTLLNPDDPDDPGGGGDDSGGSVDLSGVESGIQNIEDLINGDGSYGSPESGPIRDLDEHLLAEEEFADEFGFDSYFNDDFLENLMDEADWENIDTPTQDSALWVHRILNPIMDAFPVFVIFPLIIGLVATFLGRRYQS